MRLMFECEYAICVYDMRIAYFVYAYYVFRVCGYVWLLCKPLVLIENF